MTRITVYPSHIEVYPYTKGDNFPLEKSLSVWIYNMHRYKPMAYMIEDKTLYLPRGVSVPLLENLFGCRSVELNDPDPYDHMSRKYNITLEPRDRIQVESIEFLTSEERFYRGNYCSQFALNIDTGDGKTYSMLHAMIKMGNRSIVITHKNRIKNQWVDGLQRMCDIDEDKFLVIDSSSVIERIMEMDEAPNIDIYFVNHQILSGYARKYSWSAVREFFKKIRVGVKVIDEAHKFFENSVKIDMFSNVNRSYYLTATFGRSSDNEQRIYRTAYANTMKFGEETLDYKEKRKHIVMVVIKYRSYPDYFVESKLNTGYGFSAYKYIDYALTEENQTLKRVLERILHKCETIEGRTLIMVPKIEAVEEVAKLVREYTDAPVYTVHSQNTDEENEWARDNADIIVSTSKSTGEGDDIKGLRKLINFEPIRSKLLADQLRGRLREYAPDKDTYLFYPVDISVGKVYDFYKRILPVMRRKCKEVIELEMFNL